MRVNKEERKPPRVAAVSSITNKNSIHSVLFIAEAEVGGEAFGTEALMRQRRRL